MKSSVWNNIIDKINSIAVRLRCEQWRYDPRWWTADLEEIEIDRPIFLLGTQGGGLTFVSRILRRNPVAVSVTGNSRCWNGPDEMQNVLAPVLPTSLQLRGREELFRHGGWTYATDRLVDHFREDASDASECDAKKMIAAIKRVIAIYGSDDTACRFIDKSQSYTIKAGYIDKLLRGIDPIFVLITRDPYISCCRAAAKTNLSKLDLGFEESIRWAAQHWTNSMRFALRDGGDIDRFYTVKIEDILSNPHKRINNICEICDLQYSNTMLPSKEDRMPFGGIWDNKWYPIKTDINNKYEKYIDRKVISIVNKIAEKEIKKLNYTFR